MQINNSIERHKGKLLFALYFLLSIALIGIYTQKTTPPDSIADKYTEYPPVRVAINVVKDSIFVDETSRENMIIQVRSQGLQDIVLKSFDPGKAVNVKQVYIDANMNGVVDEGEEALEFGRSGNNTININLDIQNEKGENRDNKIIPYWFKTTTTHLIAEYDGALIADDVSFEIENARTNEKISPDVTASDFENKEGLLKVKQSPKDFVAEHGSLNMKRTGSVVVIPAGDYEITQDIFVPETVQLRLSPGVNFRIAEGVSFISYGQITAKGTAEKPITVDSLRAGTNFAVFGLLNKQADGSIFDHFRIQNGSEIRRNGVYLSGMFSAYHVGFITITNSYFAGSSSDDGLNVKYADVLLENNELAENSADALDLDFAGGEVKNNLFVDNGNDSIDISQSQVVITENTILRSGDKCMSFGENSNPVAANNVMIGCYIGVEIKDQSTPVVVNNLFRDMTNSGINSYQKKTFFGGGHGIFLYNVFTDNAKDIDFNNSFIGEILPTDDSDVRLVGNVFEINSNASSIISSNQCNSCSDNRFESASITDSNELADAQVVDIQVIERATDLYPYDATMKIGFNER